MKGSSDVPNLGSRSSRLLHAMTIWSLVRKKALSFIEHVQMCHGAAQESTCAMCCQGLSLAASEAACLNAGELGSGQSAAQAKANVGYMWKPSDEPTFFPGRQAAVFSKGQQVGSFGVVHPNVLENFDIPYPVSALELNIEPFVVDQLYNQLQTHIQMSPLSGQQELANGQ